MKTSAKRIIAVISATLAVVLLGSCAVSYQNQEEQVPDWFSSGILAQGDSFQVRFGASDGEGVNSRGLGSGGDIGARGDFTILNATPTSIRVASSWHDSSGRYINSLISDTFNLGQTVLINERDVPLLTQNRQIQDMVAIYVALVTLDSETIFVLLDKRQGFPPGVGFPPPPGRCPPGLPPIHPDLCWCWCNSRLELIIQMHVTLEIAELFRKCRTNCKCFISTISDFLNP